MKLLGYFNLKGIQGQITALVVASIVALHLLATMMFLIERSEPPEPENDAGPFQIINAAQLLGPAPASDRPRLIADINRAFPHLQIKDYPGPLPPDSPPMESPFRGPYRHMSAGYQIFDLKREADPRKEADLHKVVIVLPDQSMVSARISMNRRQPPMWGNPWTMTLLLALISVALLGFWAARALTAPLASFAKAAESFSLDSDEPLSERGPEEIRLLARALNRMRSRISGLINDRTKMLAAISHDLRTPITRMRLRCEFVEDEVQRNRMLADLNQMHSMLNSVLSFLRNGRKLEAMTLVDVASILELVSDQFIDMGYKVAYSGPQHVMATVRPDDLLRAVTNLVENAVKFGTETTIRFTTTAQHLTIDIEDNGPGICDADKANVLEPFVRGDDARNMDEATGFGLGLSIARTIVLAHGGELSLHDHAPQGLIVRIALPARQGTLRAAA